MYGDRVYATVRFMVRNLDEIRRETARARIERKARKGVPELHAEGFLSNPTAKEAEMNMTPVPIVYLSGGKYVKSPEAWLDCIDYVADMITDGDRKLLRTVADRMEWREAVETLHMDKTTYYRRRDKLFALIAMRAAEMRLITIG